MRRRQGSAERAQLQGAAKRICSAEQPASHHCGLHAARGAPPLIPPPLCDNDLVNDITLRYLTPAKADPSATWPLAKSGTTVLPSRASPNQWSEAVSG